ncbi:PP2C family protein-serine/threonine phosphatase [Psychromonas aquimarina]|uniref:PP2C family protein-serine/threonine phosphatase n=1 Tax=Psychromonas aquimarina TaxID=444919 RepID=UPI00040461C4|nr:SpoIIE family protein phosphatase [Psychromonas aquimarina]
MDLTGRNIVDCFIAEKALERVNGDTVFIFFEEDHLFVAIVDGAGHGQEAHSIALICREFILTNKHMDLAALMSELHEKIRGTRGGVAIIGKLDYETRQFRYVGVGNIYLRRFGRFSKHEITQDGVIGYHIRTPQEKVIEMTGGDILILHSDGITSRFDVNDYPEILRDDAETIANNLIEKFGKKNDDAACAVIRFK